MKNIKPALYEQLAQLLEESIDGRSFYSDIITFEDDEADYRFSATLMIYYSEHIYPEGAEMLIDSIVPVWWEFHSTFEEGERLNDFDFNELTKLICN